MPTLVDVATSLNLPFRGDAGLVLERIAPLESASASDLSFVAQKKFVSALNGSDAKFVLLPEAWAKLLGMHTIFSDDPYADFARATHLFDNRPEASRQSSRDHFVVADSVKLGDGVTIDAGPLSRMALSLQTMSGWVLAYGLVVALKSVRTVSCAQVFGFITTQCWGLMCWCMPIP